MNFLFDKAQRPHLTGDDLSRLTGVPKSTLANKAKVIRDLLRLGQIDPEFCRRELPLQPDGLDDLGKRLHHFTADPCSSRPSARMTRITVPNSGFPSGESAL